MKKTSTPLLRLGGLAVLDTLLVVVCAMPLACAQPSDTSEGELGTAVQPIAEGVLDTGNQFAAAVAITRANSTSAFCTGTLISPFWVMTARHCIHDDHGIDDDMDVLVGYDPSAVGPGDPRRYPHTNMVSGDVIMRDPDPTVLAIDTDMAKDLALIRLDRAVLASHAIPFTRPEVAGECPNNFSGPIVGFGKSNFSVVDDLGTCQDGFGNVRRSSVTSPWLSQVVSTGSVYRTSFEFHIGSPCLYHGATFGDSGGPLLDTSTNPARVCGIGSTVVPLLFPTATWLVVDIYAGMDSQEAIDFQASAIASTGQPLVGANGDLEGQCPAYVNACKLSGSPAFCDFLQSQDTDGDEIMDVCDNCRTVYNPEQFTAGDDPDGNGHGAACDFCPGQQHHGSGPLGNCNYEVELALAYPGQTAPPVITGPASQSPADLLDFSLRRFKHLNAFTPNSCDNVACPKQALAKVGASFPQSMLPDIVACSPVPPVPTGCNCPLGQFFSCGWNVAEAPNTIVMAPQVNTSAPGALPLNTFVKQGFRWCECSGNANTIADRVACQQNGCSLDEAAYDTVNDWVPIHTEPYPQAWASNFCSGIDTSPSCQDDGMEFFQPLKELGANSVTRTVRWNFRTLPSQFVLEDPFMPPQGGPQAIWVQGLMLSKIVEVPPNRVSTNFLPSYHARAQTLNRANQRIELVETSKQFEIPYGQQDAKSLAAMFWNNCPDELSPIGVLPNDQNFYFATADGVQRLPDPTPGLRAFADDVLSGAIEVIEAAEPLPTLATQSAFGSPILRAVGFDKSDPGVTDKLESPHIDETPSLNTVIPCEPPLCSPTIMGNEGLVLSGTLRRLVVIGGTQDGTLTGPPNTSAWLLAVDNNEWTELLIEPGQRPGTIVAATYRAEDSHVYFVENDGQSLQLGRYLPHDDIEALATLPGYWDSFDHGWLAMGEAGDLVFAATKSDDGRRAVCHQPPGKHSNSHTLTVSAGAIDSHLGHGDLLGLCPGDDPDSVGPTQSIVAQFAIDGSGSLLFTGAKKLGTRLIGRPIVTQEFILLTVPHPTSMSLRRVEYTELQTPPPGQTPNIL